MKYETPREGENTMSTNKKAFYKFYFLSKFQGIMEVDLFDRLRQTIEDIAEKYECKLMAFAIETNSDIDEVNCFFKKNFAHGSFTKFHYAPLEEGFVEFQGCINSVLFDDLKRRLLQDSERLLNDAGSNENFRLMDCIIEQEGELEEVNAELLASLQKEEDALKDIIYLGYQNCGETRKNLLCALHKTNAIEELVVIDLMEQVNELHLKIEELFNALP